MLEEKKRSMNNPEIRHRTKREKKQQQQKTNSSYKTLLINTACHVLKLFKLDKIYTIIRKVL